MVCIAENQEKVLLSFRTFGEEVFTPENVSQWTRDQGLPDEVVKRFADLYYSFGDGADSSHGLTSLSSRALVVEELSRCAGATLPFQNDMFNLEIIEAFSEESETAWVEEEYRQTGRIICALAVSEPHGGSDTMAMQTYTHTVDGRLILDGRKTYVNNGEYAPYILVAAIDGDDPNPGKYPSLAFWLIPRNLEGIKAVPITKIGQSMMPFASISFDNVELKPEYRLSNSVGGFRKLFRILECGRVFSCASSIGMAQAAMEDAVAYAQSRKAFGVQIGRFQQVEQMLTDMEVRLMNMRMMMAAAIRSIETDDPERRLTVALMKRYVPRAAFEVADDAMQILGGVGYTENSRVSRIWQDCRGNQIAEGTDQIMVRIAAPLIMDKYRTN
ncbi:MAG: acyl-CoA dehydrogenase family protein [Eggerthellaceae bacterium]|nr:acyl-CoA dehydrogenase family protein [Eggerthellaceae bacterium]